MILPVIAFAIPVFAVHPFANDYFNESDSFGPIPQTSPFTPILTSSFTVSPPTDQPSIPSDEDKGLKTWAIVVICFGAVVFVALFTITLWVCIKKKPLGRFRRGHAPSEGTWHDPGRSVINGKLLDA
jgi:O-antigen/teichoic acid export membrane protein